jgi:hypothetical protein
MRNPISVCALASILMMLLAACAPAAKATSPVLPQPTQPRATSLPTDDPLSVAVPAIVNPTGLPRLVVVSAATGRVFQSFAPIPLGWDYQYAFSPDSRMLAVVANGKLHSVSLSSWTDHAADVDLHGYISAVVYSPDGTLLALASGGAPASGLRIVDPKSGKVKASATLDFSVRNLRFTTDKQGIMLYGAHVDANTLSTSAPVAALLAVSDLRTIWSLELRGVRDGAVLKDSKTTDIHQPGVAWYYAPAIAFAPTGDILYALHGDEDKLTIVDFRTRKTRTLALHQELGWLDQLLSLGVGDAHAKGMDGTNKQVVISPDGKYLYAVSTTSTYIKKSTGAWDMKVDHGGLQVISIADGSIVHKQDTQAETVRLSLDGRHLYLTGWRDGANFAIAWSDVYDTASNRMVKHLDSVQLMPTYRLDGKPALVSIDYVNDNLCHLASFDPGTWSVTGDWKGDCTTWLVDP